jgi:uncharacterized RDD family membrane protein YckC
MSELTPGDPLHGGGEPPRHESGLPGYEPAPTTTQEPREGGGIWSGGGYGPASPAPPGAGGPVPPRFAETPAAGRYVLSGWWRRAWAQVIDGIVVVVGALVILALLGALFSVGFFAGDTAGWVSLIVGLTLAVIAVSIVALFYAPTVMVMTDGKTLGKMVTGCRVVRADGRPMTFGYAVCREVLVKHLLVGLASSVTFGIAWFVDNLWPLWDEEHRALHDFPVNSRVVRG